ncbi:TonB-dependent receptor plug domain-containing protein [Bradyrhizobium sp. ISRA463]|uniref:TonB-dependent receptor plug domain-containing protein n=1 Tax=Bradyrhizobium sp. ISRA463 TaxID=2866199 RepID=UPI0024783889|nr:TonB-dependent receptor plug domain-containing protein [Bradyrhizobium sp. ISRA463]WGS17105.1 TonB-dependent receptor plug domain-containing protein [Bradyrhizobium sp. ISRA463]
MFRHHARGGAGVVAVQAALLASAELAHAQSGEQKVLPAVTVEAPRPSPRQAAHKPVHRAAASRPRTAPAAAAQHRPIVVVNAEGAGANASLRTPPAVERFQLPQKSYSITSKQIDETINLKDPEDAVKYMPSLFVRKRNDGDNMAVLATRSWGVNSSARTLIYYDDLLISALIGNNNTNASPKWNLISPEAIGRIDFLNGPFAAAYPGNSIGGVLLISSKMPDKPFAVAKETVSVMPWSQYGTKDTYATSQTSAAAGNRDGKVSWLVSANYLDSYQQPLTYTTSSTIPGAPRARFPRSTSKALRPMWSGPASWRTPSRHQPIFVSPMTSRRWCRRPIRSASGTTTRSPIPRPICARRPPAHRPSPGSRASPPASISGTRRI